MTTPSGSTLSRPAPTDNEPIQPENPGQRPYHYQDQVIRIVAGRTGLPERTVRRVVVEVIDFVRESVGKGLEVRMGMLGSFFPLWQGPKGELPGRWLAGLKVSKWFFEYLNPEYPLIDRGAKGKAWAPGD